MNGDIETPRPAGENPPARRIVPFFAVLLAPGAKPPPPERPLALHYAYAAAPPADRD